MRLDTTKRWLKKHKLKDTKSHYLLDKGQLRTQYDVENVFFQFDDDCSGTLECEELYAMFEANGIEFNFE